MTRYPPETRSRAVHLVLDDGLTVKAAAGAAGAGVSTLSRWVTAARRHRHERWWADRVTPVFAFLGGYGFVLTEVRAGDGGRPSRSTGPSERPWKWSTAWSSTGSR